jgi:hypothetical protein
MYVFLSVENNFSNALNDIDVVCKSILLIFLKLFLLISLNEPFLKRLKIPLEMVQEFVFFHRRSWKIKSTNDLYNIDLNLFKRTFISIFSIVQ